MTNSAQTALPKTSRSKPRPRASAGDAKAVIGRILDSAEIVLRRHGYAGFSTRRVAQEAEIALGNLTYHFPNKSGLVRALIDRLMSKYFAQLERALKLPDHGLETVTRWLLTESVNLEAMWLFRELWAMALHDGEVAAFIDDFYDELMGKVTQRLVLAYPEADPAQISDLVHLVAMMSEGSSVIYGTRPFRASSHERVVNLAARIVSMVAPQ